MTPSQAIDKARREMVEAIPPNGSVCRVQRYVWQPPEKQQNVQVLPEQGDPWDVHGYGPSDGRPYYIVTLTGKRDKGIPQFTDTVELFNRPDYARATVWDRLLGHSDPPSG